MSNAHAIVQPSALHMTVPCPRSLTLQAQVPPTPDTEDELEGQVAHIVCHHTANRTIKYTLGDIVQHKGRDWKVDNDMLEGAAIYAEEAQMHSAAQYEEPVAIPEIHAECWGTPDYWRHIPEANMVKDADYKHGHRYVEEFENYQGTGYLVGVANRLQLADSVTAVFSVVQPRCYTAASVREWTTTVGRLRQLVGDVIRPAVLEALGPEPRARTGQHCLDCKARHTCSLLQQNAQGLVDFSGTAMPVMQTPETMGAEARILHDAIYRLKARYEGLTANIEAINRGGGNVPYWGLKPGNAPLKWDVPVQDVIALGKTVGISLEKPAEVITPTQAKSAGIDEALVLAFASRGKAALKLKPDDLTAVRKVFNR